MPNELPVSPFPQNPNNYKNIGKYLNQFIILLVEKLSPKSCVIVRKKNCRE